MICSTPPTSQAPGLYVLGEALPTGTEASGGRLLEWG